MHYIISDIHGEYDAYLKMLKLINLSNEDHLYIIGDVIDRGQKGAQALLDILTDNRVTLLLGNHELMMLENKRNFENHYIWIEGNGGIKTIKDAEENNISLDELGKIIKKECPVALPLFIGNKSYYLVHAAPILTLSERPTYIQDYNYSDLFDAVWDRMFVSGARELYGTIDGHDDVVFIIGHTITSTLPFGAKSKDGRALISWSPDEKVICMDCGCAKNKFKRLGCLRLEDMKEYYIDI